VPNPYAENNPDALRIVHLLMDVGIATSEARANGAFTQDLLHIELVGLAEVDPTAGVLNLDAVSMVEPNVLGQEYGYGMLSFQLQSYKDQNNPPEMVINNAAPKLQSWVPGDNVDSFLPEYPIVFNFDHALSLKSLEGNISFERNGEPEAFSYYVDGGALIIEPENKLEYSNAGDPVLYTVSLGQDISDINGSNIQDEINKQFQLPKLTKEKTVIQGYNNPRQDDLRDHAPVVTASYPGFPCAIEPGTLDISNNKSGRCAGGFPGYDGTGIDDKNADDSMPIVSVPADRALIFSFSEEMDKDSISLGGSFKVEKINEDGSPAGDVPGHLVKNARSFKFIPNNGWENGQLYRYVMGSGGYEVVSDSDGLEEIVATPSFNCDGSDAICDSQGEPLHTQVLGTISVKPVETGGVNPIRETQVISTGPEYNAGGPDLVNYFRGAPKNNNVVQLLVAAPESDLNNNFVLDREGADDSVMVAKYEFDVEEPGPTEMPDPNAGEFDPDGVLGSPNSAKILSRGATRAAPATGGTNGANVGCGYEMPFNFENPNEEVCPESKFTYLTGGLVAEVTDQVIDGKLKVLIWPSLIIGTSIDIVAPLRFAPGIELPKPGTTGPQILRMRYSEGENQSRTEPVIGWIYYDEVSDETKLEATVDLYVDAPYIGEFSIGISDVTHNFKSYPITMKLDGVVDFLEDGRMSISQYNTEPVDLSLDLYNQQGGNFGYADLFIPAEGSFLNFITSPVKE